MAHYTDPKCRLCRRAGVKLFLKGIRCATPKCPIERRGGVPPGPHKSRPSRRISDYGLQLAEKQKAKNIYGVLERQFKRYYDKALKVKGATGETLMQLLERRLDNAIFRFGCTTSRSVARQIVSHGHVTVDGSVVNIPSFQVTSGMVISFTPEAQNIPNIVQSLKKEDYALPAWLERKAGVGRVVRLPRRDEGETSINEQLIVEYYSK
jgi:small subunit ribosomal protein S4